MAQMQTLSIRIPEDDFQWLLAHQALDAQTPSEKLRALISKVREQESGLADPERCLAWLRTLSQPLMDGVLAHERKQQEHSDILSVAAEFIPQIMATLASSRLSQDNTAREAEEVEALVAYQCTRLMLGLLRSAITQNSAAYDPNLFPRILPDILEIATILSQRKETSHGR